MNNEKKCLCFFINEKWRKTVSAIRSTPKGKLIENIFQIQRLKNIINKYINFKNIFVILA